MCAVSMISDHYTNKFQQQNDYLQQQLLQQRLQQSGLSGVAGSFPSYISRQEFEELKKEVLEMKELLKHAVEYDKRTGQPDCHMDEKVVLLKKVADAVGVSLDDVFKPQEGK